MEDIARAVSRLLAAEAQVETAPRGGNSRVYIATANGRRYAVKQYFRHHADERDRLHAERSFLEFAAAAGIRSVPRVVASDREQGLGIYEFIAGRALDLADVSADRVREAGRFFRDLNAHRAKAESLPPASEACFTVADHLKMVDHRVERLQAITEPAARGFATQLERRWREIRSAIAPRAPALENGFERCVSPSDFGFHNALLRESGELAFLDFEYAGWDDPAKMLCDFFTHPALPVPGEHFDEFASLTMAFSSHARALEARARALLPLFQLKWCCIMLNEFVPGAAERRRFANPQQDEAAARARQLDKAGALLASIH
jgi:aminoglycoside phosphotransferase (APT) family kinase protein